MDLESNTIKQEARITGFLYFLVAVSGIFGYMYIYPKLIISGNLDATAANFISKEFLYRFSLITGLLGNIFFVATIIFLYRLLRPVNDLQAKLMQAFVLVAVPVFFVSEAFVFTAMQIFKGNLLKTMPVIQAREIADTFIHINTYITQLITFHWGLWLLPLGYLVYKSKFIPRILGVLLIINGLGYMINCITYFLFPAYITPVSKIIFPTYFIGELPLIFWLLIKGVNKRNSVSIGN